MPKTPTIESIPGFSIGVATAGIKASGRPDLSLIVVEGEAANAAGVFTQNRVVAAPVTLSRLHLEKTRGRARAILVNAGCANACTGHEGLEDAKTCARYLAQKIGGKAEEILVCSTGVIGKRLPMEKMLPGIDQALANRGKTESGAFAQAILTTDLVPKTAGLIVRGLGNAKIAGACKGSGMIAPHLATMLAFLLTDAPIEAPVLQRILAEVAEETFNCVTVDGDTSTNDTVLLLANGRAGGRWIRNPTEKRARLFREAVREVAMSLAEQIARDGEGATKLVRIRVRGAKSREDAHKAARTVAESPLVKTALFGCDPNWGRILAALGRSGAKIQEEKVSLTLCGTVLFSEGAPRPFKPERVSSTMKGKTVDLEIDLGLGTGECTMLTCDLSYDYIKINAEYHT